MMRGGVGGDEKGWVVMTRGGVGGEDNGWGIG